MLTSRVAFPPFYELFGDGPDRLPLPFITALFIPMGSVLVSLAIELKVHAAKSDHPQYFVEDAENVEDLSHELACSKTTLRQFGKFSPTVWLVVCVVVLVNALITVIYSCFVDPLHEAF